jgi:hypothetical protein
MYSALGRPYNNHGHSSQVTLHLSCHNTDAQFFASLPLAGSRTDQHRMNRLRTLV